MIESNCHTSSHPCLVILGGGASQVSYIMAARELGLYTLVLDNDPKCEGASLSDEFISCSIREPDKVLSILSDLMHNRLLNGCMTSSANLGALASVAAVTQEMGLLGASPEVVNRMDKTYWPVKCKNKGIPVLPQAVVHDFKGLLELFEKSGPLCIKPAHGNGSASVFQLMTEEEVKLLQFDDFEQVIVQPWCPGNEFSVDGLVQFGKVVFLSVAEKHTRKVGKTPVTELFVLSLVTEELRLLTQKTVDCLGVMNSAFSLDFIVGEKGPFLIDVGLQLDVKMDRLLAFAGIPIYEMRCQLALGVSLPNVSVPRHGLAMRFLYSTSDGRLEHKVPAGEVKIVDCLNTELAWERSHGDRVNNASSVADIVGWVMMSADSAESVSEIASQILEQDWMVVE